MFVSLELPVADPAADPAVLCGARSLAPGVSRAIVHFMPRLLTFVLDQSSTSIFAPQGTPARSIFGLSMLVLAICAVIFLIVAGLLLYTLVRYRHRRGYTQREPAQIYGSTQIELSWTVIPIRR